MGQHLGVPQEMAQETKLVGLVGAVVGGHPDRCGQTLLAKEGGHSAAADSLGVSFPAVNLPDGLLQGLDHRGIG